MGIEENERAGYERQGSRASSGRRWTSRVPDYIVDHGKAASSQLIFGRQDALQIAIRPLSEPKNLKRP